MPPPLGPTDLPALESDLRNSGIGNGVFFDWGLLVFFHLPPDSSKLLQESLRATAIDSAIEVKEGEPK